MVIGVSVAAPVGPMAILCVRRSVLFGRSVGVATGLGVATAHALYSAVAVLGLQGVAATLDGHGATVAACSGVVVAALGLRIAWASPPGRTGDARPLTAAAAFGSAFGLCLANPLTVASLAGLVGGLDPAAPGGGPGAGGMALGVFAGSSLWWLLVAGSAGAVSGRLTDGGLRRLNRAAGASLVAAGALIAGGG